MESYNPSYFKLKTFKFFKTPAQIYWNSVCSGNWFFFRGIFLWNACNFCQYIAFQKNWIKCILEGNSLKVGTWSSWLSPRNWDHMLLWFPLSVQERGKMLCLCWQHLRKSNSISTLRKEKGPNSFRKCCCANLVWQKVFPAEKLLSCTSVEHHH